MEINIDEIEKNLGRWHAVAPMTVAALIDLLRRERAENERLRALLSRHEERERRAKTL